MQEMVVMVLWLIIVFSKKGSVHIRGGRLRSCL